MYHPGYKNPRYAVCWCPSAVLHGRNIETRLIFPGQFLWAPETTLPQIWGPCYPLVPLEVTSPLFMTCGGSTLIRLRTWWWPTLSESISWSFCHNSSEKSSAPLRPEGIVERKVSYPSLVMLMHVKYSYWDDIESPRNPAWGETGKTYSESCIATWFLCCWSVQALFLWKSENQKQFIYIIVCRLFIRQI